MRSAIGGQPSHFDSPTIVKRPSDRPTGQGNTDENTGPRDANGEPIALRRTMMTMYVANPGTSLIASDWDEGKLLHNGSTS